MAKFDEICFKMTIQFLMSLFLQGDFLTVKTYIKEGERTRIATNTEILSTLKELYFRSKIIYPHELFALYPERN